MAKGYSMSNTARLVTAEELERFPDDDFRYELVDGRIVAQLIYLFRHHLRGVGAGVVLTKVGFKLTSNPDTVRAPDVAFIRRARIPAVDPKGFWHGPPDLAVEVLSPDDTAAEMARKTTEYLSAGVRLVVVVDPDARAVSLYSEATSALACRRAETLDLGSVIPGFRCTVNELFE